VNRTRKLLALSALALAGTGLVAGCGGDDEDAKDGLKEALTSEPEQVTEAVSSFSVSGTVEGDQSGDFSLDLSGPIKFSTDDEPGELDWTVDASANFPGLAAVLGSDSLDIQAGVTLADEKLFVTYDDTSYVAGDDLYQQIGPALENALSITDATSGLSDEQAQEFVDSFDELSEEGTEDINGESTVHYSGTLDAEALSDLNPEGGAVAPVEGVDSVDLDLYVGEEDNIPRQIDLGFSLDLPEEASTAAGVDSLDLSISAGTSNLNEPQTIEAPEDTKPLDNLLDQLGIDPSQFQIPGLGELGAGTGGGDGGLGTPGGAASDPKVQECIANAETPEAITECLDQ
jgi:hypothetical protein